MPFNLFHFFLSTGVLTVFVVRLGWIKTPLSLPLSGFCNTLLEKTCFFYKPVVGSIP